MGRAKSFRLAVARLIGTAVEPLAHPPISYRRASRTSLHAISVSAYRAHREGSFGVCVQCGRSAPCPARGFARTVIEAHADDPCRYDDLDNSDVQIVAGVVVVRRK